MRNTLSKDVSKMDVEIGRMHRELAKLYEKRARMMQKVSIPKFSDASDIDFPAEIIDELVLEEKSGRKKAKK